MPYGPPKSGLVFLLTVALQIGAVAADGEPAAPDPRVTGFLHLWVDPQTAPDQLEPGQPRSPSIHAVDLGTPENLAVENASSARTRVTIAGVTFGELAPYGRAVIRGVRPGSYQVGFQLPTGEVRTALVETERTP